MSSSFNRVLEGSKVSYLSNVFLMEELVITLLDALITKGRCLKKVIEVIILMMIVMNFPIVMKIIKKLDYSWHMKIMTRKRKISLKKSVNLKSVSHKRIHSYTQ